MKLLKPFVLVALLITTPLFAAEVSHIQAAERLLVITKAESMMDQIQPQMDAMLDQMVGQAMEGEQNRELVSEYIADAKRVINESMSWDELRGHIVRVYVEVFTETELYEIIQFYETPVGQMTIDKMPMVMQESMKITQFQMEEMIPKLRQLSEKYIQKRQDQNASQ